MSRRATDLPGVSFSAEVSPIQALPDNPALYRSGVLARDLPAACRRARELLADNDFVGTLHHVKLTYFADGLRYAGAAALDANKEPVAKWAEKLAFWPALTRLALDTWREFLLCDNAVAFWMGAKSKRKADGLPKVAVLDCEAVRYEYQFGVESLEIKFTQSAATADKLKAAGFDARWEKAHRTGGWLKVDPEKGECFEVLTWEKLGNGLGMPRIKTVLEKLSTRDLLGTADWFGAWESRNLTELWSLGHETRYGKNAGSAANFITAKKKEAVENGLRTKVGSRRVVANFDVKPSYAYLDPKFFDPVKFHSVMLALENWGGAAVQMARLGAATPGLLQAFAAEGRMARAMVAEFLARIVNAETYTKPPVKIEVEWNPESFTEIKLLLEKLRLVHGVGLMSTQTARESVGLDHGREGDRLEAEKGQPERVSPTFEKAQGMSTPGGRPSSDGLPPESA